jgi:hypothetical protein
MRTPGIFAAAVVTASLMSSAAWAAAECPVSEAADAALQREIAMLDGLKVNPADFFSGAKSCIDSSLLQTFDISGIIPDPLGLVRQLSQSIGSNVLNAAKQKVCDTLNDQLRNSIGSMRGVMNQVVSPDQAVQDALDRVTNRAGLDRISLNGLGTYGSGSNSLIPQSVSFSPPSIQNVQQPPQMVPTAPPPSSGSSDEEKRLRCAFLGQCS